MYNLDMTALSEFARKNVDMSSLCEYARQFSGLDARKISLLHRMYEDVIPSLQRVTHNFYSRLQNIAKAHEYLEGHQIENLKQTHLAWVHELFNTDFDVTYTRKMYMVGDIHVRVKLPVEFMGASIGIIQSELVRLFGEMYVDDQEATLDAVQAINAATAFSLLVMQKSYHSFTLAAQLESFLLITGISQNLFDDMRKDYRTGLHEPLKRAPILGGD
ncbi:MAG: protoglobin domain-containing protein [Thiothrix sp.]